MREGQRILRPSSLFMEAIEEGLKNLQETKVFLEQSIEDPERLFKDGHKFLGQKNMANVLFNSKHGDKNIMYLHDFQTWLASLINIFVQSWAKEHGIDEKIEVLVRNPNTFPSIFAIYYESSELIQFNIADQYFGNRVKFETAEEINLKYLKQDEDIEKSIAPLRERIKKNEESAANLWRFVWKEYRKKWSKLSTQKMSFKKLFEMIKLLFWEASDYMHTYRKKDQWVEHFNKLIESDRVLIKSQEEMKNRRKDMEEVIKTSQACRTLVERLIPLFEQYEYRLVTVDSMLY